MHKISQKKISDESSRNAVRMGLKKKLPAKVSNEIGIPQANKIGREMSVINSCRCTNEIRLFVIRCAAGSIAFIEMIVAPSVVLAGFCVFQVH